MFAPGKIFKVAGVFPPRCPRSRRRRTTAVQTSNGQRSPADGGDAGVSVRAGKSSFRILPSRNCTHFADGGTDGQGICAFIGRDAGPKRSGSIQGDVARKRGAVSACRLRQVNVGAITSKADWSPGLWPPSDAQPPPPVWMFSESPAKAMALAFAGAQQECRGLIRIAIGRSEAAHPIQPGVEAIRCQWHPKRSNRWWHPVLPRIGKRPQQRQKSSFFKG